SIVAQRLASNIPNNLHMAQFPEQNIRQPLKLSNRLEVRSGKAEIRIILVAEILEFIASTLTEQSIAIEIVRLKETRTGKDCIRGAVGDQDSLAEGFAEGIAFLGEGGAVEFDLAEASVVAGGNADDFF